MRHGSRFGVHGEDPAFVENGILSILAGIIHFILPAKWRKLGAWGNYLTLRDAFLLGS